MKPLIGHLSKCKQELSVRVLLKRCATYAYSCANWLPATGNLDTSFSLFFCLYANAEMGSKFQVAAACFANSLSI
jgi:hypothetical protein